jgi:hypothetical protein
MVVERGDATGSWYFSNITVLQSSLLKCTVHQLGESVCQHLWIVSKMAEKSMKTVLTVKQKLKLTETCENG